VKVVVVDNQIEAALKQEKDARWPLLGDEEAGVLREAVSEAEAQIGSGP
jgi:hypothetical protein